MVIIMVLVVVCALFAIVGGLAFTEVTRLRTELLEKQLTTDKAMSAIDVYRARTEASEQRYKAAIDHNQVLSKNLLKSRDRNGEALNRITVLEYQASCRIEVCDRYFEELKVLRSQFNESELLKQKYDELTQKHQSILDTLPDWAGGEDVD